MSSPRKVKVMSRASKSMGRIPNRGATSRLKQSLRTSTDDPNPETIRVEETLAQFGLQSHFMSELFEKRCDEIQLKPEEDKYRIFVKHFLSKVERTFLVSELRLKEASLLFLLKGITYNCNIVGLDLSFTKLSSIDPVLTLISGSDSLCKLHLCNMSLQPKDFAMVFDQIMLKQQMVYLDLSNRGFEGSNRVGENYSSLIKFIQENKILQVLELEGLSIKDKGLEALIEGFKGKHSNIASLNLKNNGFSRNGYSYIRQILLNTRLLELNISENRLGSFGLSDLDILRLSDMTKLNLTNTDMESEGLATLMSILKDNKSLTHLTLDKNNFHHNWFKRIEESMMSNKSIKVLSMNSCNIKYLDSLFRALFDNHFVSKLDISNTPIGENMEELVEMVKRNNTLKELKLKQCGLEANNSQSFVAALNRNRSLKVLEMSENSLGAQIGRELLKSVNANNHLTTIGLERTQVELSVKASIEDKLDKNRVEQQRQKRLELHKENTALKNKTKNKPDNLTELIVHSNNNKQTMSGLRTEVAGLGEKVEMGSSVIKSSATKYESELAFLNQELTRLQMDSKPRLKELEQQREDFQAMMKELAAFKQRELQNISKLEGQLERERQGIKALENKLEKQLQNEKYLNKKTLSLPKLAQVMRTPDPPQTKKTSYRQFKTISKIDVRQRN